jgi:hypothetical protein
MIEVSDYNEVSNGRMSIWSTYINAILNLNVGIGLGASFYDYLNYHAPHNSFLSLVYDMGIIKGTLFFCISFLALSSIAINSKRITLTALLIYLFISSLGNDSFFYKYYWFLILVYIFLAQHNKKSAVK